MAGRLPSDHAARPPLGLEPEDDDKRNRGALWCERAVGALSAKFDRHRYPSPPVSLQGRHLSAASGLSEAEQEVTNGRVQEATLLASRLSARVLGRSESCGSRFEG